MKAPLLLLLALIGSTSISAESNERQLQLAGEMQTAVLKTQDIPTVQAVLGRGFDINSPIGCGTFSALDGAIQTQNPELLKFLLTHGAKPRGHELADAAFASGHQQALEMVRSLLKAGVDANTRGAHSTALIQATYRGNTELVALLLTQRGLKLEETDVDGYTALMWAVKHGSSEFVDQLLRAGANPKTANAQGETAAILAQQEIEKQRSIISKLQPAAK